MKPKQQEQAEVEGKAVVLESGWGGEEVEEVESEVGTMRSELHNYSMPRELPANCGRVYGVGGDNVRR